MKDANSLRKLISEAVQQVMLQPQPASGLSFQEDIHFLKDYNLVATREVNGASTFKFEFKTSDSSYMSHAFIVEYPNGVYKMRLEVDWKVSSKDHTAGAGKDFVMSFGPFTNYQEFVSELNRRLHNNPMIGTNLYNDNNDKMLDHEIIKLLNRIKDNIQEIKELNHPALKTLERMYEATKDMSHKEIEEFFDDEFRGWAFKQGVIYNLQAIDKLPYYRSFRKGMHATKTEPFAQKL